MDKTWFVLIMSGLAALILLYLIFNVSNEYILIDGNDVIEYEIIDGNTIIIYTEDENYTVELFDEIIDFTVNSNMTIELTRESVFGNPFYDCYFINRIIKLPDIEGGE